MKTRLAIALLAPAVLTPVLRAQVRGPGIPTGVSIRIASAPPRPSFIPRNILLGVPYFYPSYADEPIVVQAPAPQVVFVQAPAAEEVPERPKPEALLIEWQGDRYVRLTHSDEKDQGPPDYAEKAGARSSARPATDHEIASRELEPVVLVFRDGHREEVGEYVIADGAIYARGDYWVDGYWNKKILFSSLDLPATLIANREASVEFVLPSGPNVVVTRP